VCVIEHESHGLHEFCTSLRPCGLRDAIKLISHRNHGNHRPTRYESVGCDDGAFRVPKEYEAFGESHDASPVLTSGMIAFSLTQTTQKTQKFSINANLDTNLARIRRIRTRRLVLPSGGNTRVYDATYFRDFCDFCVNYLKNV
jgi:hypothetical protein